MEWTNHIKSKRYIAPTKGRSIYIIALNICLIFVIIAALLKVWLEKDFKAIFGIVIPLFIVRRYKGRKESTGYYEFCIVAVTINQDKIFLDYENLGLKVEFAYENLETIEYSDKLVALRLMGFDNISGTKLEHVLYLEKGQEQEFLENFIKYSGKEICYVDRGRESEKEYE